MNKKYLMIAGIIFAIVISAGSIWLYSQESEQPTPTKPPILVTGKCGDDLCEEEETAKNCPEDCEKAGPIETKRIIGFAGVSPSDFSNAKELGALAIFLNPLSSSELQSALETAKSLELDLIGRAESRKNFQKEMYKIDFVKLKNIIEEAFSENEIANNPNLLGYYIIDEPCHENKWDITPAEFREFYDTVKSVDPDIKIMVNFGYLSCLENFITEDKWKIVDIATFVITPKKLRESPDFIDNEAACAKRAKELIPDLQIIPLIAVYEYPAKSTSIPSADWIRQTGMEVLRYDNFDGIIYFPWNPSSYMGDTIEDIDDNPKYIRAFRDVFNAAR